MCLHVKIGLSNMFLYVSILDRFDYSTSSSLNRVESVPLWHELSKMWTQSRSTRCLFLILYTTCTSEWPTNSYLTNKQRLWKMQIQFLWVYMSITAGWVQTRLQGGEVVSKQECVNGTHSCDVKVWEDLTKEIGHMNE